MLSRQHPKDGIQTALQDVPIPQNSASTPGRSLRVAIQGAAGSNSHMAALALLGDSISLVPCTLSAEVVERAAARQVDCAVLPIENSLHGSVAEHYDLLLEHPIHITAETLLRIRHNVIAPPGVSLAQVRRVLSHPVALSQCRRWLRANPHIEAVPFYDTAGSVHHLMKRALPDTPRNARNDTAAIAPELAATQYSAHILVRGIEDHPENYTRFYRLEPALATTDTRPNPHIAQTLDNPDKMSLAFTLAHQPGTLIAALEEFRRERMNLTRIESRPVPGRPWEYVFYVDVRLPEDTQPDPAQTNRLLGALAQHCQQFKVLGLYQAAS